MSAQFIPTPPLQDGLISAGEYGGVTQGTNTLTSSGVTWYMTWDATNLYLAIQGANVFEGAVVYLDSDPNLPVNAGPDSRGSVSWNLDYDRTRHHHPFRSDFAVYFKDGYHEYRYADGTGDWNATVANSLSLWANSGVAQIVEIAIPWNIVSNGLGRPSSFNWYGYKLYNNGDLSNGTYSPVPAENPTSPNNAGAGASNDVFVTHYFSVVNTDNLTATAPFAARSFTYHEDYSLAGTGGYYLGNETFFDLTVYDNSLDNLDNDQSLDAYNNNGSANRVLIGGDVIVNRNLVVGQGSAIFPADNSAGAVSASITLDGSAALLYNQGRIDCTPEVAIAGHELQRRLALIIDGQVVYSASPIFKDRSRFSDITITPGHSLIGPATGSAQLELQYGTLLNQGLLNFHTATGGTVSFDTRGDISNPNNYYLSSPDSTGVFILDGLLIGRNSSTLRPLVSGGLSTLQLHGDFENYHEFIAQEFGGGIDIVMVGAGIQEIRGNVLETQNAQTVFHNLSIANDNGLGDSNAGSDVHFTSFGGGEIDYLITGQLELVSGDLVTRDRVNPALEHIVLIDAAAEVDYTAARSDDASGLPSCFVDGPLYRVQETIVDTLFYPIGDDGSFRETRVLLDRSTAGYLADTTVAELFHASAYTLNNTLPIVPEMIDNISLVHWWHVETAEPFAYDEAKVLLSYDVVATNDGVSDPTNLRLLKAPSGGSSAWVNESVARGSVETSPGVGYIWSDPLFGFSDFTLGNLGSNPLPVELLSFDVKTVYGREVLCHWQTASEVNSSHFELYHATEILGAYSQIAHIEAAGYSSELLSYEIEHKAPVNGYNYYRLVQVDIDGVEEDFGIRASWVDGGAELSVYPNPSQNTFEIRYPFTFAGQSYRVLDGLGRIVTSGVLAKNGHLQVGEYLPSGRYQIEVKSTAGVEYYPLLKH